MMNNTIRIPLLILAVFFLLPFAYSQKLSLGGKIGTMAVRSVEGKSPKMISAGYGGITATYTTRKFRLGFQVEVNYLKAVNPAFSQVQIPVSATFGLDKRNLVRLHAGSYMGIGAAFAQVESPLPDRRIDWGLNSGVEFRIPVSDVIVLTSDINAGCSLARPGTNWETLPHRNWTSNIGKRLTISLSVGIAFSSGKRKGLGNKNRKR